MPTADRLQQAEQQFSAGNTVAAVRLLRDERLAAGAHRDILTLRRIMALARRIESGFPGTAAGLIYAAQGDLSYAESQEEIARANLAEARASVEAGNDRAASVALERALRKELEKWPQQRDRDLLEEIAGTASTIASRGGRRSRKRLDRVVEGARLALSTAATPPTVHPESVAQPTTPPVAASGGRLRERLDAVEERIHTLERELAELRRKDLPELRALAAGAEHIPEPQRAPETAGREPAPRAPALSSDRHEWSALTPRVVGSHPARCEQ